MMYGKQGPAYKQETNKKMKQRLRDFYHDWKDGLIEATTAPI